MEDEFKKNTAEAIGIANEEQQRGTTETVKGYSFRASEELYPRTPRDRSRREPVGSTADWSLRVVRPVLLPPVRRPTEGRSTNPSGGPMVRRVLRENHKRRGPRDDRSDTARGISTRTVGTEAGPLARLGVRTRDGQEGRPKKVSRPSGEPDRSQGMARARSGTGNRRGRRKNGRVAISHPGEPPESGTG